MQIQNCFHPHVIKNRVTGEEVVVPCGKCAACLNNRVLMMTTRCDLETQCHKYAVFGTLTYADYDVPQVVRLRAEHVEHKHDVVYIDSSTGEFFDFYDKSVRRHTKKDVEFCFNTKVLPVLCKSDFQKFIKLVRYYANQIENGVRLRYFLTGEYGPSTYRPHGHFILWFDSDAIAQKFKEIIYKAWKHGAVHDPHIVNGSASSYVASYVNSFSNLPSIYQHRQLRPFSIFSKFPALGTLSTSVPDIRKALNEGLTKFAVCLPNKSTFVNVPFWRSLSDRFCPRIQRFGCLSRVDRVKLYRLVEEHNFDDVYKFAEFIYYRYVRFMRTTEIGNYFYNICHLSTMRKKFSKDGQLIGYTEFENSTCVNSLVRFCSLLFKAKNNAQLLNLSITDYVNLMSDYYEKVDKEKFKEYLDFQDQYFKTHPVRDYLLFDYTFVNRVNGKHFDLLSRSDQHYLRLLGVVDDTTDIVRLSLDDCLDYHLFVAKNNLLAEQLTKNKVQFDYLLSQGDDYNNIKTYFST